MKLIKEITESVNYLVEEKDGKKKETESEDTYEVE